MGAHERAFRFVFPTGLLNILALFQWAAEFHNLVFPQPFAERNALWCYSPEIDKRKLNGMDLDSVRNPHVQKCGPRTASKIRATRLNMP